MDTKIRYETITDFMEIFSNFEKKSRIWRTTKFKMAALRTPWDITSIWQC